MIAPVVVVDASIAISWFIAEPHTPQSRRLLGAEIRLAAPDLVLAEAASGLRRKERMNVISEAAVRDAITSLVRTFSPLVPSSQLVADAVVLSQRLNHNVYDCIYVIASRMLSAPFVTNDRKLVRKLADTEHATHAIHLDDWSPP